MNFIKRVLKRENLITSYILPVLLILCMFAVVIFVGMHQLSESEERIHEEALLNLKLNVQVVSQQLNDFYVSLEATAPMLAVEEDLTKKQMLHSMSALREACGFDYVVRTNMKGLAFNYLGKGNINLAGRQYIQSALKGNRASEYVEAGKYDPNSA